MRFTEIFHYVIEFCGLAKRYFENTTDRRQAPCRDQMSQNFPPNPKLNQPATSSKLNQEGSMSFFSDLLGLLKHRKEKQKLELETEQLKAEAQERKSLMLIAIIIVGFIFLVWLIFF